MMVIITAMQMAMLTKETKMESETEMIMTGTTMVDVSIKPF